MESPRVTILKVDVVRRWCPHCVAVTVQVGRREFPQPRFIPDYHCLQCIADGGTCCSLAEFNRHAPEPKRPPR